MEKLNPNTDGSTPDIAQQNLEQLKAMFPELITEGEDGAVVNVDVLKTLVGDQTITDCNEKYGLNWHGKRAARQLALTPSTGTLRPCPEDSVDWETTWNLMIEGDNLEVLKLLQKSYAGKVNLIYIDPPYNTGKDFVYRDSQRDTIRNYLEMTGQLEGGAKLSSNVETSGRFHTDWLCMMYGRMKLARSLLSDNGMLLCSIDDHECSRLRMVLDEVFGGENFLAKLSWRTDGNFDNQAKIKICHEYVMAYAKSAEQLPHPPVVDPNTPPSSKLFRAEIRNTIVKNGPKNPLSQITLPPGFPSNLEDETIAQRESPWPRYLSTARIVDGHLESSVVIESGWSCRDLLLQYIDGGCQPLADSKGQATSFEITSGGTIEVVKQRSESQSHVISVLTGFGGPQSAAAELAEIGAVFDGYPKPTRLLQYFVTMIGADDALVLDFFAGSGTTGHAVMSQNAVDGGKRRYLLVQLPEPLDPENEKQKAAAAFCDELHKPRNIAELTKERLRRAAKKVSRDNPMFAGDIGFRVFKLDSTNLQEWEPDRDKLAETLEESVDHLKDGRTETDILYELLLKLGLDLCVPIEEKTLAEKTVHSVGAGTLFVCLADQIDRDDVEALAQGIVGWRAELDPASESTVVFRDSAFVDDVAKTNLAAILEQHGLENVRSL